VSATREALRGTLDSADASGKDLQQHPPDALQTEPKTQSPGERCGNTAGPPSPAGAGDRPATRLGGRTDQRQNGGPGPLCAVTPEQTSVRVLPAAGHQPAGIRSRGGARHRLHVTTVFRWRGLRADLPANERACESALRCL